MSFGLFLFFVIIANVIIPITIIIVGINIINKVLFFSSFFSTFILYIVVDWSSAVTIIWIILPSFILLFPIIVMFALGSVGVAFTFAAVCVVWYVYSVWFSFRVICFPSMYNDDKLLMFDSFFPCYFLVTVIV